MKLQFPFIQLPLQFDAEALAAEVAALGKGPWRPHPQNFAGNSMLPLVATKGDPADESFAGSMQPTPQLEACPYLMQIIASLGVTVGRARLMRLSGHAEVTRHVDQGYYWSDRVRVHVPIVTQPTVRFECGDATVNMAAGECWIFDTWRQHNVLNDAVESRTHLVVDTVGGDAFWEIVAQGRPFPVPVDMAGWQARKVAPQPGIKPTLAYELVNIPTVMSPWELSSQLSLMFNDTLPHPQLGLLQNEATRLVRTWRALWAQYGDSVQGRPHFRALIKRFFAGVEAMEPPVTLRNAVKWRSALKFRIVQAAVVNEATQCVADEGMSDRG